MLAKQKNLYAAVRNMTQVIVRSRVSNLNSLAFCPTSLVFADVTVVFAFDDFGHFGILQSSLHTAWLEQYSSTMRTDVRYVPSRCFDTFAFPANLERTLTVSETYYQHRRSIMEFRQEGLTKTYTRFNQCNESARDIQFLRDLHVEMDNAVAAAYGWSDLDLAHGFHETKQGVRFTISEAARREVLARLLKLNHERYAEEVAQGLHDKGKGKPAKSPRKRKGKSVSEPSLFGEEEDLSDPVVSVGASSANRLTPREGDQWYFAYGSNLWVDRKEERTGTIRQAIPCRLAGYRFAFNKRASKGYAYANIVPDPSGEVWGVAYLCNPEAMRSLDRCEGVDGGHYERVFVEPVTVAADSLSAVAYVAGRDFVIDETSPSPEYLHRILSGARHHGLPEEYIARIESLAQSRS